MSVLQFLSALARDPSKQLEFRLDPEATARASGVPEAAIAVLATRDSAKLRELLATGSSEGAFIYSPETAAVYSPETAAIYSPESALVYSP
jgi:DNA primase